MLRAYENNDLPPKEEVQSDCTLEANPSSLRSCSLQAYRLETEAVPQQDSARVEASLCRLAPWDHSLDMQFEMTAFRVLLHARRRSCGPVHDASVPAGLGAFDPVDTHPG